MKKITAIVAEYNPFHNGHAYQIREARRITGADCVMIIMSGNFVQRGEPALLDKFFRAEMALHCGADVVLELPAVCACASAEYFASGATALLNALGCVDSLCFGSEYASLESLTSLAHILAREPQWYRKSLQDHLKQGLSYPKARAEALTSCPDPSALPPDKELSDLLARPNHILALEYLKALEKTGSPIRPIAIPRVGCGYHDQTPSGPFASATAVRKLLTEADSYPGQIGSLVPSSSDSILRDQFLKSMPMTGTDFSSMLHYVLLTAGFWEDFSECFDVPGDLARRIFSMKNRFSDLESFAALLKTKNLTETSVHRALFHILLQMPPFSAKDCRFAYYARLLGFRKSAAPVLKKIKQHGRLPLITKLADAHAAVSDYYAPKDPVTARNALQLLELDIRCSELYRAAVLAKFGQALPNEYERPLVIL